MKQSSLTNDERRTLVLIKAYEDCRRARGQFGYSAAKIEGDEITIAAPIWKSFGTVYAWMKDEGFTVGWAEEAWHGFVKYVFEKLHPTMPQPGQLKNRYLLSEYLKSTPQMEVPEGRSDEEMESIYKNVLHPEIAADPYYMALLGVKKV